MSAASPGTPSEETGSRSTGPGHLLRTARESAGMGVREVSAQLRLDERTVTALESDDFRELPAPTFVRGYLRGYARLLGVPVGPVMEAYDREGFAPPDLVADIAETPDASTRDIPVRLATLGVVAVLVVLVVLWWNNQAFNDLPAPVPQSAVAPEIVRPDTPVAPLAPATTPAQAREDRSAVMQGSAGSRDESAAGPTPKPSAGQDGAPLPALTPGVPADNVASAAPTPPATPAAEVDRVIAQAEGVLERARNEVDAIVGNPGAAAPDDAGSPASDAQAAASSGATATATPTDARPAGASEGSSSGEARLVARFPIEAWVEIYDRDDARLFYNLAKPGRVIDVSGAPPIRVLLGRTRGVTLEFNGEAVDLTPHTERGVARLTLGQ